MVFRILQSRNKSYKVGEYVMGYMGWATRVIVDPDKTKADILTKGAVEKVRFADVPRSYSLGVLGMPGSVHESK